MFFSDKRRDMFKKLLIIAVAVLFALGILKDQAIKAAVTIGATQVVGAPVHIDGMSVGVFRQSVRIKGLKIYNPAGFSRGLLVDIPTISVDYDLPAILKGDLHLPFLVLDLKEMTVIRNKEGRLNVDALKVAQKGRQEQKPAKAVPLRIDAATLNLGKVIVKDYTKGQRPSVQVYDIGVHNKTFRGIKSAEQFAALVMVQSLGPTALKNAAIYGAASFLGVAVLPIGAAAAVYHVLHDMK